MKIDIGCGYNVREGYEGVDTMDCGQRFIRDVREAHFWDTLVSENKLTHAHASHFLEHLTNEEAIDFLNDLHLAEALQELYIVVPQAGSPQSFSPVHMSYWSEVSFRNLERKDYKDVYGISRWKVKKLVINERPDIHVWLEPIR